MPETWSEQSEINGLLIGGVTGATYCSYEDVHAYMHDHAYVLIEDDPKRYTI